jgi:hypothetical protein
MSWVIASLKERTLIVVPNLALADQTKVSIEEMLPGLKVQILDTDGVVEEDTDVLISFVRRLCGSSRPLLPFKTVIFDEVHMLSTVFGIAAMLTLRPNHLLALTATPGERNDITELFVGKCQINESDRKWSVCFPKVYSGITKKYTGLGGYTNAMNDLSESVSFMNSIVRMLEHFVSEGKRSIVLTMRCEMSDKIAEYLLETETITYNVLTPKNRMCDNCDIIIGTYKLIGTGFDLRNYITNFDGKSADVVVFIGSIKDTTLMYQSAGRSFRSENPLAIYPLIADLPISVRHTKELMKNVKDHGGCTILHEYTETLEGIMEGEY